MSGLISVNYYLYIKKTKQYPYHSVRTTVRKGKCAAGEIVMYMTVELPSTLFEKPVLTAKVTIPAGAAPKEITASTIANIKEILDDTLGIKVELVK